MAFHAHVATRPDHVPPEAVFDFDYHRDAGLFVDPHDRIVELTGQAPRVFWTPHNGGHWMALGYEESFQVMREHEMFSSSIMPPELTAAMSSFKLPDGRRVPSMTPIFMDPPLHTKMRAPLQGVFSPKNVMKLTGDVEALAASLVDATAPQGACDFLSAVIEQLPVRIFLRIMGLPDDRIESFRALVRNAFAPRDDGNRMDLLLNMRQIGDAMAEQIEARRTDPGDDLISLLWSVEVDGAPMTLDLMEDYCSLLFMAGLDTVINAMGHGVRHLAANPALQAELRARPELIGEATEELLRRYTISAPIRRATRDTDLAGRAIKEGDLVVVYLSAADLDARTFPEPEKFDLARQNKTHLIFGAGPHRCLGSHLARIEINALYRVMLKRLPPFRLDPEKQPVFHAGNMLAITALPLRWD